MFCPKCGTDLTEGSVFCHKCGYDLNKGPRLNEQPWQPNVAKYSPHPYNYSPLRKSELVTIILGVILPGAGHLYIGKLARGLMILTAFLSIRVIYVLWWLPLIGGLLGASQTEELMSIIISNLGKLSILIIVDLIIWVSQLIDVYSLTNKYNEELRLTGQPPW